MNKTERIFSYGIVTALLILSTFFDFTLTSSLYNPQNGFGRFFYLLGEAPFELLAVYATSLAFRYRPRQKKGLSVFFAILFLFASIALSLYGGGQITVYLARLKGQSLSLKKEVLYAVLFSLPYFAIGFLPAYLVKLGEEEKKQAFAYGFAVLILYLGILLVMNAFKMIWMRPRYRVLVKLYPGEESAHWYPWYKIAGTSNYKNALEVAAQQGITVKKDDFYSFPSGHTMNAVAVMALAYACSFLPHMKKVALPIRIASYIWGLVVAFSRIFMGDHNATDGCVGWLLGVMGVDFLFTFLYPHLVHHYSHEKPQEAEAE